MCHVLAIIVVVLAAIVPQSDGVLRDQVDVIEVNHFYDDCGRLVFTQTIFWDWSEDESGYHVRAWRLVKQQEQLPRRDHAGGGYVALWQDGEAIRAVHALGVRETWTQFDVELVERETFPVERRRPLRNFHKGH